MTCSVDGCSKQAIARGWCHRHYDSWRYHGDPLAAKRPPAKSGLEWIREHLNHTGVECLIWPFHRRKATGYAATVWPEGVKGPQVLATRYMCELVNGPAPSPAHEAAHKCGKGHHGCIHPRHLKWATRQENMDDKLAHGTVLFGERNPCAKLTEGMVRKIRKSGETLQVLADRYYVSIATISDARIGRTWRHLQ